MEGGIGSGNGSPGKGATAVEGGIELPSLGFTGAGVSNSGGLVRGVACTLVMSFAREQ